jgi:Ca-activated chloride channel family protein
MKHLSVFVLLLMSWAIIGYAAAQRAPEPPDKTLSPYFLVKSDDPNTDQLPLKSASAAVNVAGVIADVKVTQVYQNEGKNALEAIYVFPASTRASVYGMKMTIGERTIIAKIQEREKARQDYEQAKQEGKSASLLEQQRPNVFQMNVANILPGDVIKVELSYTELLIPTDGIYELVYPTVVGPRYSNMPEAGAPRSEGWVQNPYLHQGESPTYQFDITVNLAGSMPIQEVTCATHKVNVSFDGPALASVKLDPSEKFGGNKDYILKYRLAGGKIESGLLLYSGEKENFFLLMVQPPERVKTEQIPPREYVFIVDVSGSMRGFPLDISKELLKKLIGNLRPSDKFNVLLFAGTSALMSEQSLPATSENITRAIQFIDMQRGGGGTELLPALNHALELKGTESYSRSMVIVTDGYVHVEKEAFDLIRNRLGDANMFAFGIGSSVNRFLIEGMARVGMGEPFVITKPEEAPGKAEKFRQYIQTPVLTNIRADFRGFDVYDAEPPAIPDVLAERPLILFGKWKGSPKGKIKLTGISGSQDYVKTVDVSQVKPLEVNAALPYLWARHRISLLSDYNKVYPDDDTVKEVTRLGLTYSLLTEYTSFVAIDSLVRRKDGKLTTVTQALPLPEGVSDSAVGGASLKAAKSAPRGMSMPAAELSKAAPAPFVTMKPDTTIREQAESEPVSVPKAEEKRDEAGAEEKPKDTSLTEGNVLDLPEKMKITGSLSKQEVQRVFAQHFPEIETCFRQSLKKAPGLKGSAVLKVRIDSAGKVTAVEFISSELTNEELKSCIVKQVKQWQFHAPADGKAVTAEYSLVFHNTEL